jgi:D-galactarolactone cycloisomerase
MNRRIFLSRAGLIAGAGFLPMKPMRAAENAAPARAIAKVKELRITRIMLQQARGRRLTPVAPNAYAAYRGYEVSEPVLRLQTSQGFEGFCHLYGKPKPELLKQLLGLDPFTLFEWQDAVVRGPTAGHQQLLAGLGGADIALFDLLGKALRQPVAGLLGKSVRQAVTVYDSSLYMEDLLKPNEREGLAYLKGNPPGDPAEMVARKAQWILNQPEGVHVLKIKIGRVKWMTSFAEALARDIAVFKAVRQGVGRQVMLFVDGNDGYKTRPLAAADFAEAVRDFDLQVMEEMFPETMLPELREVKRRLRTAGLKTRLAEGENHLGGTPPHLRAERFAGANGNEPLFDIDQPDMNQTGYLRLRENAKDGAARGMTVAPHNFGSKLGLYAMIHLGLTAPNFEFCESDDTQIPAIIPTGIIIRDGKAQLTGAPGLGIAVREEALEKPILELT